MNLPVTMPGHSYSELHNTWQALRRKQPGLRIRNAAQQLGISEMQLLLTEPQALVIRLEPRCTDLMCRLAALGPVMTLTRNNEVVHETTGVLHDFQITAQGAMGLCLGEIDLRVFFRHWVHALAVNDPESDGSVRQSLQFFSVSGDAVFKVYKNAATNADAWQALIEAFRAENQRPPLSIGERERFQRKRQVGTRWEALQQDWSQLEDVHHFHALLQKHDVDRLSALENIGDEWAYPVAGNSLECLLQRVVATATPLMVFVGNPGVVQIFTGTLQTLRRTGAWYNVLDKRFNLHVNTEQLSSTWVVRRPSGDGDITSLECFNAQGELVVTLFGERKPGKPELRSWRERIQEVARLCP